MHAERIDLLSSYLLSLQLERKKGEEKRGQTQIIKICSNL
jgi:hypothetical protein